MFKRAHHYLTCLLVVILILAAPMKVSEAIAAAQAPPGLPDPPPEITAYTVLRDGTDPARPLYNMEIYGHNGFRMFLTAFTEVINAEEILQDVQITFAEASWPFPVFLSLFPVECEQTAPNACRNCVIDEIRLCFETYLGTIGVATITAITAMAVCMRVKWAPAVVACILGAAAIGIIALCVSVTQYQNCYRAIPAKCNAISPGCISPALWGVAMTTCRDLVSPPR